MSQRVLANRHFLMFTAGFIAAAVILFSSSLYQAQDNLEKAKAEQTEKSASSEFTITTAPSDVLPGGGSLQLTPKVLLVLEHFLPVREAESWTTTYFSSSVRYTLVLLRTVISPNAP